MTSIKVKPRMRALNVVRESAIRGSSEEGY
jgi:hypothetical protein